MSAEPMENPSLTAIASTCEIGRAEAQDVVTVKTFDRDVTDVAGAVLNVIRVVSAGKDRTDRVDRDVSHR